MTNTRNIIKCLVAVLAVFCLMGCLETSTDDCRDTTTKTKRSVTLRLAAAQSFATRSVDGLTRAVWQDGNADSDGEMMRNCFVVVVQNGMIQNIITQDFADSNEKESVELHVLMDTGETTFYSFANVSMADVGLDAIGTLPTPLPQDFESRTLTVEGNGASFDNGIPMSNKQTVNIDENTSEISLGVVRMVAKVKLQFDNQTGYDLVVNSVALSDITDNAPDNLMLLPANDVGKSSFLNISPGATYSDYMVTLGGSRGLSVANGSEQEASFYVNESQAHSPKYFVLTIDTNRGTVTKRIAMTRWSEIARNDFLVIPVKLVDFRIAMEAEAFTAIGVKPDIQNDMDRITLTFGNHGEFHLRTHVYYRNSGQELTNWSISNIETLDASPKGGEGIGIYDEMPLYNAATKLIEGYMGNRSGYAIHELTIKIDGIEYDIPYRIQVVRK